MTNIYRKYPVYIFNAREKIDGIVSPIGFSLSLSSESWLSLSENLASKIEKQYKISTIVRAKYRESGYIYTVLNTV